MLSYWLAIGAPSSEMELPFHFFIYHLSLVSISAVLLDLFFSELSRFHPLSAFGRVAAKIERIVNPYHQTPPPSKLTEFNVHKKTKRLGLFCCISLILSFGVIASLATLMVSVNWFSWLVFDSVILYFCIGLRSMRQHVLAIAKPIEQQQFELARKNCGMIVSRDVENLTTEQMCKAAVESTIENTNDAVIASLFWYAIGGIPFAIAHRLSNTLDAMWGYKSERYRCFGWAAAKLDDILAWPTAKITGFLFALQGLSRQVLCNAIRNAHTQCRHYKSRNGGFVMAAGATVLGIQLGGEASYQGVCHSSGVLGESNTSKSQLNVRHIKKAIVLMNRAVATWLAVIIFVSLVFLKLEA